MTKKSQKLYLHLNSGFHIFKLTYADSRHSKDMIGQVIGELSTLPVIWNKSQAIEHGISPEEFERKCFTDSPETREKITKRFKPISDSHTNLFFGWFTKEALDHAFENFYSHQD